MEKQNAIIEEYDAKLKLYKTFTDKVRQLLEELIESEKISYNAITCRVKDKESFIKKIELKQGKYNTLKDITDIAGIRIITFYSDDVDKVANLIEKEFEVDKDNTIDKRKAMDPDRFGYCSVHYIVGISVNRLKLREYKMYKELKCEIQIRTVLQHAWAEIEHDIGYKSAITVPQDIRRNFSRLAGLLEIADKEFWEIREYLNKYMKDVSTKIHDDKLDNKELDSIILAEFIKTDKNIQRLNNEIEKIAQKSITIDDSEFYYYRDITKLQWLGIRTFGQLKALVEENGEIAIKIAQLVFKQRDRNKSKDSGSRIGQTIGLFYLCYAELLKNHHDAKEIEKYFELTQIKVDKDFINFLLEIQI